MFNKKIKQLENKIEKLEKKLKKSKRNKYNIKQSNYMLRSSYPNDLLSNFESKELKLLIKKLKLQNIVLYKSFNPNTKKHNIIINGKIYCKNYIEIAKKLNNIKIIKEKL